MDMDPCSFDQEEPEYGMAAIPAAWFAEDTIAVIGLEPPEGTVGCSGQLSIALEKVMLKAWGVERTHDDIGPSRYGLR